MIPFSGERRKKQKERDENLVRNNFAWLTHFQESGRRRDNYTESFLDFARTCPSAVTGYSSRDNHRLTVSRRSWPRYGNEARNRSGGRASVSLITVSEYLQINGGSRCPVAEINVPAKRSNGPRILASSLSAVVGGRGTREGNGSR